MHVHHTTPVSTGHGLIDTQWRADNYAVRSARYNRNQQNPGSACSPSPCGENTNCMVNGQVGMRGRLTPPRETPSASAGPGSSPTRAPSTAAARQRRTPTPGCSPRPPRTPAAPPPAAPAPPAACRRATPSAAVSMATRQTPTPSRDASLSARGTRTVGWASSAGKVVDIFLFKPHRTSRCVKKPDPCQPNPCGRGAACTVNSAGTLPSQLPFYLPPRERDMPVQARSGAQAGHHHGLWPRVRGRL